MMERVKEGQKDERKERKGTVKEIKLENQGKKYHKGKGRKDWGS